MEIKKPLVSIGVPTYNRASKLQRTIASALGQDYKHIEVIISDNASTDETQKLCLDAAARDDRVIYVRQAENRGMTANLNEVLRHAHGEFFMWLADDDWISQDYVSRCTQVLLDDPEYAIACGWGKRCDDDGRILGDGDRIELAQGSGTERVLNYFRLIRDDGTFYGVMRREQLLLEPLKNTLAGDWLLSAAIIFTGKAKVVHDSFLFHSVGGASATRESALRSLGMPLIYAKTDNLFYLKIATSVFYQILAVSPSFKSIGVLKRLSLACSAFRVIQQRFMSFRLPLTKPVRKLLQVWSSGQVDAFRNDGGRGANEIGDSEKN